MTELAALLAEAQGAILLRVVGCFAEVAGSHEGVGVFRQRLSDSGRVELLPFDEHVEGALLGVVSDDSLVHGAVHL